MANGRRMRAQQEKPGEQQDGVEQPVQLGPLSDFIGFHLRLAQEASFRAFAQRAGDPGLKPTRFAMLLLIRENPGISQTALSRASGRDKSTLTTALDDLVRRGWVLRERGAEDRRSYRLHLTAKGRAVLTNLVKTAQEHDRRLDAIVGAEGKPAFLELLRRITAELD